MGKAEFDRQGKYLWHLVCTAGWDRAAKGKPNPSGEHRLTRFESYLLKTFKVTHYNALNEDEIRRAIATLKPYADKAKFEQCKVLRSQIVATVMTRGRDLDWLHDNMRIWKYGDSLRELGYNELIAVRGLVQQALGISNNQTQRAQRAQG